jgi:hypothetical protein
MTQLLGTLNTPLDSAYFSLAIFPEKFDLCRDLVQTQFARYKTGFNVGEWRLLGCYAVWFL